MLFFQLIFIIFVGGLPCSAFRTQREELTQRDEFTQPTQRDINSEYQQAYHYFQNPSFKTDVAGQFLVKNKQLRHFENIRKEMKIAKGIDFSNQTLSNALIATGLTPAEAIAIFKYTHMEYQQINPFLRGKRTNAELLKYGALQNYSKRSSPTMADLIKAWDEQRGGEDPPWGSPAPAWWVGWTTPEWRQGMADLIQSGLEKLRGKRVTWHFDGHQRLVEIFAPNPYNGKPVQASGDRVSIADEVIVQDLYRGYGTLPKDVADSIPGAPSQTKFENWMKNPDLYAGKAYIQDPAFCSSTLDKTIALNWAVKNTKQPVTFGQNACKKPVYALKLKGGNINMKAHDIEWLSQAGAVEKEYLMERDVKLVFTGKYEKVQVTYPHALGVSHGCDFKRIEVSVLELEAV